MRSLKDLAKSVRQKANVNFFAKSENNNYLPGICAQMKNKGIFIIYLTYVTILHRIRIQNFQLKLFDIAVTMNYGQGH